MNLEERISKEIPALVAIRHDLHQHPEIAYEEKRTASIVVRELEALGIQVKSGLAGGTGVLGYLPATVDSPSPKTIAIRADMDALPIHEETGLSYASQTAGKMHACGHDGHTTIVLGVARVLSQIENRPNNIVFVFQPAEEKGAGGKKMVLDGAVEGVDAIFGLHGWPTGKARQVATRVGAMMASADVFNVTLHGKGGHAAFPHGTVDSILILAQVIVALQSVASRNVDPLEAVVVTVAKVQAGSASNIIPEFASLVGTLRTLNDDVRALAMRRITEIVTGIATSMGGSAEIEFVDPYPVTVNHPQAVSWFRDAVKEAEAEEIAPVMGAEDFSYYGKHVPACFFTLGLKPEEQETYPGLHTPQFDFNDEVISTGIESFCKIALKAD